VRIGARWFTSIAEVYRFVAALSETKESRPAISQDRKLQVERAEKNLQRRGI
jgi:hypothetical protein